jgi:AraC-like DNA-binding protein
MTPAGSIEAFVANRHGRWVSGERFLVWSADPTIGGGVAWGRFDAAELVGLERALAFDLDPARDAPYDLVFDGRRIEGIAGDVFEQFERRIQPRLLAQEALIRRVAIIVPPGLVGAVLLGTPAATGARFAWRAFAEAREAFAWLGRDALHDEVEAVLASVIGGARAVPALRNWFAAHLERPLMVDAARALGRSSRTLQRDLAAAGTSFRAELERTRVDVARALLVDGDAKIEAIGRRVGCASHSAFSALFVRVTGESPSAFRARHRE